MADAAHVQRPKRSLGALSVGLGRVLARCEPVCCQAGAKMGQNGDPTWAVDLTGLCLIDFLL